MPATSYLYSISSDFPNGKVNTSKLQAGIQTSSIVTALDRIDTNGDVLTIWFKDALSAQDKTTLDSDTSGPAGGLIASSDTSASTGVVQPIQYADANGNPKPQNFDADGSPIFIHRKSAAAKFNQISPNWCDKTTWYERSVKSTAETLADSGDHTTFNSANGYWIDISHGKLFNEDILVKTNSNKWIVTVTVDGVAKTQNSPGRTDHDYTVNFVNGTVTFNSALGAGHTVLATYWYSPNSAGNSTWTITPPAGTKIELLRVELQFSKDIILNDSTVFQPYGYVDAFAPFLMSAPYNYPSHTIIPLGDPIIYKTVADFVAESNGAYPLINAFGGNAEGGWRGQTVDIVTLVWDYVSRTDLKSSQGVRLCLSMKNDTPHAGNLSTATFYCLSLPE